MSILGWLLAALRGLLTTVLPGVLMGVMFIVWYEHADQQKRRAAHRLAVAQGAAEHWRNVAERHTVATEDEVPVDVPAPLTPEQLKGAVKEGLEAFLAERSASALLLQAATTVSAAKLAPPLRSFAPGTPLADDNGAMGPPRQPPPLLRRSTRAASPATPRFRFTVSGRAPGSTPGDAIGQPFDDNATM